MALCVLVNIRFQVLFHSPPGVLFTFPSQYCFTIGHRVVFRLGGWAPRVPYGFLVSVGTLDTGYIGLLFAYKALTFSGRASQPVRLSITLHIPVRTPAIFLQRVWPLPISLATTFGISFDFSSSAYLDVSVRRVPFRTLWIHARIYGSSP